MIIHLCIACLWMIAGVSLLLLIRERFRSLGQLTTDLQPASPPHTIGIIVPARNEEQVIEDCLLGLLTQKYPRTHLRVIVVDDNSDDRTAAIVKGLMESDDRLTLLKAPPLPQGWHGKQHACWYAAQQVEADWLCFIDADTRHSPALISSALNLAVRYRLDLLSLHPRQEMKTFWERLLMPIPFITLMMLMDARRINDPSQSTALANGQFILIRSEVYAAIDGHRSVRTALLEDVEIGRRVKGSGYRIAIHGGGDLIETRMYRDLTTLWNALARNGSELFGPILTLLAVLNAFFAAVFPWLYPLWLGFGNHGIVQWLQQLALLAAMIGSLSYYALHALAFRIHSIPLWYLLLIPVSDILIGIVNLQGLIQRFSGRRTWKGRTV